MSILSYYHPQVGICQVHNFLWGPGTFYNSTGECENGVARLKILYSLEGEKYVVGVVVGTNARGLKCFWKAFNLQLSTIRHDK